MHNPDLLIVGGGVIGGSIAYHAAREGLSVVVLDRRSPAAPHSASWASAGGVRRQGRHPAEVPLAISAIDRWPDLAAELDADLDYQRGGNLKVAENDEQAVEIKHFAEEQRAHGLTDVTLLSRAEILDLVPGIASSVIAGSYAPRDGQADPVRTTAAFAGAAQRLGARYRTDTTVDHLITSNGRITGARAGTETVSAGTTVLAAAAGATPLAATAGLRLPVRAMPLQMVRTSPAPATTLRPVLGGARRLLSLKQLPDGAFLLGGGWQADLDPSTDEAHLLPDRIAGNRDEASALLPIVADHPTDTAWYGIESESIDGLPFLGEVPDRPGLLLATGFSGHGFALSPAVGALITAAITGAASPADYSGLRAERMADLHPETVRAFLTGAPTTPSAG